VAAVHLISRPAGSRHCDMPPARNVAVLVPPRDVVRRRPGVGIVHFPEKLFGPVFEHPEMRIGRCSRRTTAESLRIHHPPAPPAVRDRGVGRVLERSGFRARLRHPIRPTFSAPSHEMKYPLLVESGITRTTFFRPRNLVRLDTSKRGGGDPVDPQHRVGAGVPAMPDLAVTCALIRTDLGLNLDVRSVRKSAAGSQKRP